MTNQGPYLHKDERLLDSDAGAWTAAAPAMKRIHTVRSSDLANAIDGARELFQPQEGLPNLMGEVHLINKTESQGSRKKKKKSSS